MSEIGFYHLTRSSADQALPQLLGRTLAQGARALVLCGSAERVAALDAALWICPEPEWLPHGTKAMGFAEHQPVWITDHAENPNGASFLFLLDGASVDDPGAYARVFDLFDGNSEEALQAARGRYRKALDQGHQLGARGWEKKR